MLTPNMHRGQVLRNQRGRRELEKLIRDARSDIALRHFKKREVGSGLSLKNLRSGLIYRNAMQTPGFIPAN